MPSNPPDTPEAIYLSHLKFLEELASRLARRNHMSVEEAEDFASLLKTKLWEDDYATIRKFRGSSKLRTYLTFVATNAFRDYRNQRWGKWRPSAQAERLGAVAIKLEEITTRDGYSFEEACEILRTNHRVELSREEILAIWSRLPPKSLRRMEGEEVLQNRPAEAERPEGRILERELAPFQARVNAALRKALEMLPSQDRLLVRMRILEGFQVAEISRELGIPQKPLYRRIEKLRDGMRKTLADEGISREQIGDLLNRKDVQW